ncbi:MAG: hypothetical protein FWD68_20255 [Alphaproteobacteria bacterium]|nr:hypothetical protein [Alphaproteobacteria bacterium]
MGIVNIIDNRQRPYRFLKINVIVEAAWHDNSCKDAEQVDGKEEPLCEEREHITLEAAIAWANSYSEPVTLYVYHEDGGLYPLKDDR